MTFMRKLGRSGIQVNAMGMGCWAIGGPFWRGDVPVGWSTDNPALARIFGEGLNVPPLNSR